VIGEGEESLILRVAMANPPNQPAAPVINRDLSLGGSLVVEWDEGSPGDIPVDGFKLYMIEKGSGTETLIYDGS
jgi:hypothetical protein